MFRLLRSKSEQQPPIRPRRRWKRRLAVALALLLLLVWFAPAIAVHAGILDRLVNQSADGLKGSVRIGGASLSWFSAIELGDVEVRDERGQVVLRAPKVRGTRTLFGLLCDHSDLGEFVVEGPTVFVRCAGDSTNIEDMLAGFLAPSTKPASGRSGTPVGVKLTIEKARIELEDVDAQRQWVLHPVQVSAALSRASGTSISLQLQAENAVCRLDAGVQLTPAGEMDATLKAATVPMLMLEPFLRRFEPGFQSEGTLTANLEFHSKPVEGREPDFKLEGSISGASLNVSSARLNGDRVRLEKLDLPCRVRTEGNRVVVEQLDLQCDLGKASLKAAFDPTTFANFGNQAGVVAALDIDLAKLAAMLPKSLAMQKDTNISSGRLTASVASEARGKDVVWQGSAAASSLKGTSRGRPVAWEQPIKADFTVPPGPAGLPAVDRFHCESDFLTADVSGTADRIAAEARVDLDRLTERLGQFIDLGKVKLAGSGSVKLAAVRGEKDAFRIQGDATLRKLLVAGLTTHPLREDETVIRIDVVGKAPPSGPVLLTSGGGTFQAGPDGVGVYLVEAVDVATLGLRGAARMRIVGDLGRWRDRLRAAFPELDSLQASGILDASAVVRYEPNSIKLDAPKGTLRDLRFRGLGLNLDEQNFEVRASSASSTTGRLELKDAALVSSAVTVNFPSLAVVSPPGGSATMNGSGSVQGDLARLQRWFGQPGADPLHGAFSGTVAVRTESGRVTASLNLDVRDAFIGPPAAPTWREPLLKCSGKLDYDSAAQALRLNDLKLEGAALALSANGTLSELNARQQLALDGKLTYDLAKLEAQLRPLLGAGVKLRGQATRPIQVRGPLGGKTPVVTALTGEAGVGWETLQAFGCDVGAAELKGRLSNGMIQFEPITASLNGGKFRLEGAVRFDPEPSGVYVAKGTIIDHARITPAMCASALGYVAPLVAQVAEAEGELSVQLDPSAVPFDDVQKALVNGRLVLHSVKVGPGPLLKELSLLLKNTTTLQLAKESTVPFHLVNGRVHHQNLELTFPDTWLRTSGSVGLDGTLDLVAETPVPAKWLGNGALAPALAKQTIKVPIRGTLSQPKLNEAALRKEFERFAKDAARDSLIGELENRLKGALLPKK